MNVHYGDILVKFGELLDITTESFPYIVDDENSKAPVRDRRYDATLLINGLPMIHIELKNKQHSSSIERSSS